MKKILAFAGSNSKTSINKQLVSYASGLVEKSEVTLLDLNDFELPLFGTDYANTYGIPENAHKFLEHIKTTDGILLALAEHNGVYTSVFKNLFDWMSLIEGKTFFNKPMLLMATSPGERGGASVLEIAKNRFPYHEANIIDVFSLPFFTDNFLDGKIIDHALNKQLIKSINKFEDSL